MNYLWLGLFGTFALGVAIFLFALLYLVWAARIEQGRYEANMDRRKTSCSAHTRKPACSIVPLCGQLILAASIRLAREAGCPLILSAGKTVPGETRTEAQIYRDEALAKFGAGNLQIITGMAPNIRETLGEARETNAACGRLGSKCHVAVALAPHIGRVRRAWRKANPLNMNPEVYFFPVKGPWEYWLWEALVLCGHLIFPAGSRRQALLLDLVGRRG